MAFLKKKKKQPQKIWERQMCVLKILGKNLGLSHSAIKKKKSHNKPTLPLGAMQDSQPPRPRLSRESESRWHPDFLLVHRPWLSPKLEKIRTESHPELRAAVAAPHTAKATKDLSPQRKPSASITESIPLRKSWGLRASGENTQSKHTAIKILLGTGEFPQTASITAKTGLREFQIFHLKR